MLPGWFPIYKDGTFLIHGPEMEQHPLALLPFGEGKAAAVPQEFVRRKPSSHAGQRGFRRKGDRYPSLKTGRNAGERGKTVIPHSVQIDIGCPYHSGTGIFLPCIAGIYAAGPPGAAQSRCAVILLFSHRIPPFCLTGMYSKALWVTGYSIAFFRPEK